MRGEARCARQLLPIDVGLKGDLVRGGSSLFRAAADIARKFSGGIQPQVDTVVFEIRANIPGIS
jgi:hypothetical protein